MDAREQRRDDQGRPPFGLCHNEKGRRLVPDRESGEFAIALEVIRFQEAGRSWRDTADEIGAKNRLLAASTSAENAILRKPNAPKWLSDYQ